MKNTLIITMVFASALVMAAEVKNAKGAAPAQPPAAPI